MVSKVKCTNCARALDPDEVRVKDGNNVLCLQCYVKSQIPARDEKNKEKKCVTCGKTLTIYDDKMQDAGKTYCKTCYDNIMDTSVREKIEKSGFLPRYGSTVMRNADKLIECSYCGFYLDPETVKKEKNGKLRCPKCGKVVKPRAGAVEKAREEDYGAVAQLFKCLGDPCRVKIIELLSQRELYVFEFVDMTGFQYSAISYHLKMLKEMGMVKSYEKGNFVVYTLTDKGEVVHEFIKTTGALL